MNSAKYMKSDKQFRSSVFTLILALFALISGLLLMLQVTAWFINVKEAEADLVLSNFEIGIEYCTANNSWKKLEFGAAVPVVLSNGKVKLDASRVEGISSAPDSLQIRITYTGISNACIRASVHGSFQNADTKTYLPQINDLWSLSGTKWSKIGNYWYYSEKLGDSHDPEKSFNEYTVNQPTLEVLTISIDPEKLSGAISPHQDYQGELYIFIDAVQPDRQEMFWG